MIDGWAAPENIVAHARRFYAEGGEPATPRFAATVLLLRSAGPGFETYVIRRVAGMAFGGAYAFPGGRVDASDASAHVHWAGPDADAWSRRLGVPPARAQAVVCAAAREVFEEAGVLLAGPRGEPRGVVGDVSGDDWEAARRALVARETGFADLLAERGLALRSDLLAPWTRWVTPEFEPRRFDTYFFVAALPEGQRTRDVSGEADHTEWVTPAQALRRAKAGEITMLPPTMAALQAVGECGSTEAVFAASADRDAATPITPRLDFEPDGTARFRYA